MKLKIFLKQLQNSLDIMRPGVVSCVTVLVTLKNTTTNYTRSLRSTTIQQRSRRSRRNDRDPRAEREPASTHTTAIRYHTLTQITGHLCKCSFYIVHVFVLHK